MERTNKAVRVRATAAAVVGGALALAACGSATSSTSADPAAAIHQSVSGLTSQTGIGLQFSLGVTAAQVQQLEANSGGSKLTAKQAQALATGSVFFDVSTGHNEALASKQAATDPSNAYEFGLSIGSDTPFELAAVAQNYYVRVVIAQFQADTGANVSSVSKLAGEANSANAEVPGVSDLAAGKWVEVTHSALQPLLGLLKAAEAAEGGSAASANTNQYRTEYTQLSRDIASSLKANSTYAKVGTTAGRTEYADTVQLQPFLNAVASAFKTDLASLPGGIGAKYATSVSSASAKIKAGQTVVMDVFVKSNRVAEVDIDLEQFATGSKKVSFPVPLRIVITNNPSISAPAGATPLDLSKVPALLGGLASNSSSSGTSAGG